MSYVKLDMCICRSNHDRKVGKSRYSVRNEGDPLICRFSYVNMSYVKLDMCICRSNHDRKVGKSRYSVRNEGDPLICRFSYVNMSYVKTFSAVQIGKKRVRLG